MSKAIIYSDENVLAAQQALRSKTARNVGKTRSQVAEFLADDIRRAIEQGYRLKDIKNILAKAGISISIAKMQSVLEKRNQAEISSAIHSAIETEKTEIFVSKLQLNSKSYFEKYYHIRSQYASLSSHAKLC